MVKRPKSPLTWNALCELDKCYSKSIKCKALKSSRIDWSKLSKTDSQWLCHPVVLRVERLVVGIVKRSEFSDLLSVYTHVRCRNNKPEAHYDEKHVDAWIAINIHLTCHGTSLDQNLGIDTYELRKHISPKNISYSAIEAVIEKRTAKILACFKKKDFYKGRVTFCRGVAKLVDEFKKSVQLSLVNIRTLIFEEQQLEIGFDNPLNSSHIFIYFSLEDYTVRWFCKRNVYWKRKSIDKATAKEILNDMV